VVYEGQVNHFNIYQFEKEESFHSILTGEDFDSQRIDRHSHVEYLFRYLRKLETKCLIVEEDYTDIDYIDSFANYYSSCYIKYPRSCKRIHAFSISPFDREHFSRLIKTGGMSSESPSLLNLKESYLGFIVILPLPETFIGRTILSTHRGACDQGSIRNYSCTRSYEVNLFGLNLTIHKSLAFQQQDKVIMACASVSIWCALHRLSDLFDIALPRPSAITKAAVASFASSRGFPSKGLTAEQICKALVHFGLEPEVISVPGKQDLPMLSLIYGYLRMGFPIILGCSVANSSEGVDMPSNILGGHAITLVGYKITDDPITLKEKQSIVKKDLTKMISLRMSSLYAHDDQQGPFSKLEVQFTEKVFAMDNQGKLKCQYHPIVLESQCGVEGKKMTFYPVTLIIPAYHKIRVPFIDIYSYVVQINDVLLKVLGIVSEKDLKIKLHTLEWDVYLTTTNDLKDDVRRVTNKCIDLCEDDGQDYDQYLENKLEDILLSSHPRFIWRGTLRGTRESQDIVEILDFFADATGMAEAFPIYDMIWYEKVASNYMKEFFNDTNATFVNEQKKIKKSLAKFIRISLGIIENEP
jgi:hypothetical protein